ncbi:DUF3747 domain-containing protein [Hyella patelloides]|nr:DUF3747 domain-containing protein [Hyella patelloides]
MKPLNLLKSLFFGTSILASSFALDAPQAMAFGEQEVNQQQFIAVAIPYNYKQYRLEIIEQLPGGQQCWRESGTNPSTVELLLDNFDHTNSCRRISNTNGYTLRVDGQDDRVARIDKIVRRNGELQLIAFHKDPTQPDLVIGKTTGISDTQPLKINFNPGWSITKRVHEGQTLNHVYISGSSATATNNNLNNTLQNTTSVDSANLINTVNQVYGDYVNPLLNTVVSSLSNASNNGNFCQGIVTISDSSSNSQNASIYADGTLVLNNQNKINIRPALAQYGINPEQFLFQKGTATIDFDNDGVAEELTIQQPVAACQ